MMTTFVEDVVAMIMTGKTYLQIIIIYILRSYGKLADAQIADRSNRKDFDG